MIYDIKGSILEKCYNLSSELVQFSYDMGGNIAFDGVQEEYIDYENYLELKDSITVNENKNGFYIYKDNSHVPLDYCKNSVEFIYRSGATFGIFLGGTLAYFDGEYLNVYKDYIQNENIPTTVAFSCPCTLVDGETYMFTLTRKSYNVIATIGDFEANGYVHNIGSAFNEWPNFVQFGHCIFSGSIYIKTAKHYMPYYAKHVKALIVGDSITEGVGLTSSDYEQRYSWQLLRKYFNDDCITCGVGGATIMDGYNRVIKLLDMGYTFDYVIYYLGTNNGIEESEIDTLAQTYQSVVDGIKNRGCKIFCCVMPIATVDKINNSRTALLKVQGVEDFIRFDNVLPSRGAIHPDASGHLLMFNECVRVLSEHNV